MALYGQVKMAKAYTVIEFKLHSLLLTPVSFTMLTGLWIA